MSSSKSDDNYFRPEQKLDADLQRELDEALGDMSLEDILEGEVQQQEELSAEQAAAKGCCRPSNSSTSPCRSSATPSR